MRKLLAAQLTISMACGLCTKTIGIPVERNAINRRQLYAAALAKGWVKHDGEHFERFFCDAKHRDEFIKMMDEVPF